MTAAARSLLARRLPGPSALPAGEAHVWTARCDGIDGDAQRTWSALLSSDEHERMRRFHFERDRRQYLVGHGLLRALLSQYTGALPHTWRFATNAWGRPEIAAPADHRGLRFNLSHTPGLVAVIVARDLDVGVDVEVLDRAGEHLGLADSHFSPDEVATLRALPAHQQPRRFVTYWTLKEAYIKARGMGLSLPLDRFTFVLDAGRPVAIRFAPEMDDDASTWRFAVQQPTPSHLLAHAVRSEGPIAIRTFDASHDMIDVRAA